MVNIMAIIMELSNVSDFMAKMRRFYLKKVHDTVFKKVQPAI